VSHDYSRSVKARRMPPAQTHLTLKDDRTLVLEMTEMQFFWATFPPISLRRFFRSIDQSRVSRNGRLKAHPSVGQKPPFEKASSEVSREDAMPAFFRPKKSTSATELNQRILVIVSPSPVPGPSWMTGAPMTR